MLTIVIPTYKDLKRDWTQTLFDTLQGQNVIVIDTPSDDGMEIECKKRGFSYVKSKAINRAGRLNDGIKYVNTPWVIFHHPRSTLEPTAFSQLLELKNPSWGAFTHKFDDNHPLLTFTSFWSNHIRGELQGVYYLDHCLFSHVSLLSDKPRPFGEVDVFEDTIFCKRLKSSRRPIRLKARSTTSSIRFRQNGIWRQAVMNQFLKIGYFLGLSHTMMNRWYEKGLDLNQRY
ncbi:MAG: glycosyl transferase, family 2 [Halobacteriovorax sp.]|nr:glycosyl transferase, family 2 [Halobacteriovorax sp.]